MRIRNQFRIADKGKVLINLNTLSSSLFLPLVVPYKEVKQEEEEWEIIKLKYDLED